MPAHMRQLSCGLRFCNLTHPQRTSVHQSCFDPVRRNASVPFLPCCFTTQRETVRAAFFLFATEDPPADGRQPDLHCTTVRRATVASARWLRPGRKDAGLTFDDGRVCGRMRRVRTEWAHAAPVRGRGRLGGRSDGCARVFTRCRIQERQGCAGMRVCGAVYAGSLGD